MKKLTAILCLLLAASMVFSLASCTPKTPDPAGTGTNPVGTEAQTEEPDPVPDNYAETSTTIYNAVLGDFNAAYQAAKAETNVSKKWAMMAIAEAKLMESAVMLPTTTSGGNYAISRVAPYTIDYSLWGNDDENWHTALIATEFIEAAHRTEMKAKWNELKGTGEYLAWAKQYLADKGYTLQTTYSTTFNSFPKTWDVLATSRAADSQFLVKTYDGLLEYDCEGTQKPALATEVNVSEDGKTYTFKLRDAIWVDSQGRKVADVKADDFVAGIQHSVDAGGGLDYLVDGIIVGIHDYIEGKTTDFSTVGVKATDDKTLVYTLEAPCSYFLTMFGYGIFAPLSRTYYESQGGKFGADFDKNAEDYTYGKTQDNIAYCGAFIVKNATDGSIISFEKNENYWNKDAMNIDKIEYLYNDGKDEMKAYNDAKAGTTVGVGLTTARLKQCREDGLFDKYGYTSATDATSYMAFFNINRFAFRNIGSHTVVTPQTAEQAARTNKAMQNVNFRRALAFSLDRANYNAQAVGDELKLVSLRNSYTPAKFVYLEEDVTVDLNGKATEFKAGTPYGEIMQAQIDADGLTIKVYDKAADEGNGSGDGYDGWYNPTEAMNQLNTAIAALADLGITKDNPIQVDLPYPSARETYTKKAQAVKQSVEAALQGFVQVNLTECKTDDEWYYAGYYTEFGYEANYDIYDLSGWGPDYGDPSTYLDTFLPDGAGYMIKCIGIF
ncbi:MAG: peptide ABC transporter substrate-binding protein [Clostridia bacterium]|nr:peptide ABC transporter substrate-binding protein [Clostridia bacterium]